jgi:hypothetical protein
MPVDRAIYSFDRVLTTVEINLKETKMEYMWQYTRERPFSVAIDDVCSLRCAEKSKEHFCGSETLGRRPCSIGGGKQICMLITINQLRSDHIR